VARACCGNSGSGGFSWSWWLGSVPWEARHGPGETSFADFSWREAAQLCADALFDAVSSVVFMLSGRSARSGLHAAERQAVGRRQLGCENEAAMSCLKHAGRGGRPVVVLWLGDG